MKAILIDDEYYALQGLRMELEQIGGIEVVGIYENGKIALEELDVKKPDIVFLDIEMPGITGIELFGKLIDKKSDLKIVFITAYNHYAVQAFELNAVDYLVKPVQRQRLIKTIQRLSERIERKEKNISIKCFRHFSILIDKIEINKGWRTKKAEELLAYLICEKGRFVSKEKIAEALWPDLDGEKSMSNLYLAYYYIKKQAKNSGIIFPIESGRGKMCLKMDNMDCDIIKLDSYIEKCTSIDEHNIETAERVLELYIGMPFEDSYYAWAVEIQQYYENMHTYILKEVFNYYEKQGNIEKLKRFK